MSSIPTAGWALVSGAALLFLMPALWNGYPFIFMDSSNYVILTPRLYRSPFYQLFVYTFGLKSVIWGAVIVQALLTSFLIYRLTCRVSLHAARDFAVVVILLTLLSGISIYVGFVMLDIFTALMFLTMFLLIQF